MAKTIDQLAPATSVESSDLFIIQQSGTDKKVTTSVLQSFLNQASSTILPSMASAIGNVANVDIGSPTARFNNIYAAEVHVGANSLYVNGKQTITDVSNVMTFQTDTDQAIVLQTMATAPGSGNANLGINAANLLNLKGSGGVDIQVPNTVNSRHISITNSSAGGNIQLSALNEIDLLSNTKVAGNLQVTQDVTINGQLTVSGGSITEIKTQQVLINDNILTVNSNQTGTPSSTLKSGLEVERGDEGNYQFLFDESFQNFRVGLVGQLQAVATRQDSMTDKGIPIWNSATSRLDSTTVTITGNAISGNLNGVATYANALASPRNITLTGDATGTAVFDGSQNISMAVAVASSSFSGLTNKPTTIAGYGITDAVTAAGSGLTKTTNALSITPISAGSTSVGAIYYNGVTPAIGNFDGGTTAPADTTTRLNFNGNLYASTFIGSHTGNSSSATKAGDGAVTSNIKIPLSAPTIIGNGDIWIE